MATGPLDLDDDDFWTDPYKSRDATLDRVAASGFTGYLLDGPAAVPLDRRATLPLAGARRLTLADDAAVDFWKVAQLAVVRLESNETFAGPAFPWEPPEDPDPPPPAPAAPPEGTIAALYDLDARAQLPDLPWREGTLLCTLLVLDQASNRVRVALRAPPPADPEVARFQATHRVAGHPQPVWPPLSIGEDEPVAHYRMDDDGLPYPAEPDLVMEVDPEAVLRPETRCVLRGSFTAAVRAREIVRPFDPHEDRFGRLRGAGWQDVGDPDATAVVPVTLVVAARELPGAYVFRLQVPVYTPLAPDDEGRLVQGCFAVDLFRLPGFPLAPQDCHLWAFSGEEMGGPLPLRLVAE